MAADLGATWHPDGARRLLVLVILTTFAGGCGAETVHTDHPPVHRDSPDHPAAPTMDTADLPPLEDVESMPPPGMQVDWAKAFPRIDVNGDGVATELELARFLDHSHMTLAAKEREMMLVATMERLQPEFKKHDADGRAGALTLVGAQGSPLLEHPHHSRLAAIGGCVQRCAAILCC